MNPALLRLAMTEVPRALDFLRETFMAANPGEPQPTDAQVIAAYREALASSLTKDAAWLAAHPEAPSAPDAAPGQARAQAGRRSQP